jgi:organic radical activating enzyme
MDCKFLTNGINFKYFDFVIPCCEWKHDEKWVKEHNINKVNIITWHQHPDLVNARKELSQGIWPKYCSLCQNHENQNRQDSLRYNGLSAYQHYSESDITLEIRPGNVCNFACQTCWPAASTRVATFYKQSNIPDSHQDLEKNLINDFSMLLPITNRLKSIVLLGGEPFYDPNCLNFLNWCTENTSAEILVFTNGSVLDLDLLKKFKKITLVFSLDAVGKAAEYIRFGTIWDTVLKNFNTVKSLPNVTVRVNITTSVYNFYYFSDVIEMLLHDWPEVVSFGVANKDIFREKVIPLNLRKVIIDRLQQCCINIIKSNIESNQKANALKAIKSIINNLINNEYDPKLHEEFKLFVNKMDQVKKIKLQDYCQEISSLLVE